jgi:uncharacterized protein
MLREFNSLPQFVIRKKMINPMERRFAMSEIKKGTNKFFLGKEEQSPDAELVFKIEDNTLVIEHTYVSENLRGQGVGGKLVDKTVQFARDEHCKIISQCAYAQSILEKNDQYNDVFK